MTVKRGRTSKAEATRSLLIEAALKVIGRKGYTAATVDEIVEEAGVSKGVAYYHFKNKAAMGLSVLESGLQEFLDAFEAAADDAPSAAVALSDTIRIFAGLVFENESFGRFFVTELWREGRDWSDSLRDYEARLMGLLRTQIARGIEEGTFRKDLDPDFTAVSLVGMVLTTSLHYTMGGSACTAPLSLGAEKSMGKEEFVDHVIDFARRACAA